MGYTPRQVLHSATVFYPKYLEWGQPWEQLTFGDATISFNTYLVMVAEAILATVCNYKKNINRLALETVWHRRMESVDFSMSQEELLFWLYRIVSEGHQDIPYMIQKCWGVICRDIYEMGLAILETAIEVYHTGKLPEKIQVKATLKPASEVKPEDDVEIKIVRDVYLICDHISTEAKDMEMLTAIANRVNKKGIKVRKKWRHIDGEWHIFADEKGDFTVAKMQYNCAGNLWGYTQPYFQKIKGKRKMIHVNMSPKTTLKGLAWLPRAHDDNFSPGWFKGLANPYQKLVAADITIDESRNYDTIATTIYDACTEKVAKPEKTGAYKVTGLTDEVKKFLDSFKVIDAPLCYNVPKEYTKFLESGYDDMKNKVAPVCADWVKDMIKPFIEKGYRRFTLFKALGDHMFKKTSYEKYSCTKYGAKRFWELKHGNCADHSSLAAAVFRTCGFPTGYIGGYTKSGIGHFWNEVFLYDRWFVVDINKTSRTRAWYADPKVHSDCEAAVGNQKGNKWLSRSVNINC